MKFLKLDETVDFLNKNNYLYKGNTVTKRTVQTMMYNGFLKKYKYCECGYARLANLEELNKLVEDYKHEAICKNG